MKFDSEFDRITPGGLSLDQGKCGIVLAYFLLYQQTGKAQYKKVAEEAFTPVLEHICDEDRVENIEGWGAIKGIAWEIYTALFIYKHNLSDMITAECMKDILINNISDLKCYAAEEDNVDLLSGIAGILGVYIAAYESNLPNIRREIYDFIDYLGEILLSKVKKVNSYSVTWVKGDIGYAHGNAGIIAQLARLYRITNNKKIKEIINKALRLERSEYFDEINQKWKFRKNTHYFSWSNGIGGLILEKIMLLQAGWEEPRIHSELKLLCNQLKRAGLGTDYCICHGDWGSLQLLKVAGKYMKDIELCSQCDSTMLGFMDSDLSVHGNKMTYKEDWGLMNGLTAMGMALLAENEKLIEILCLQ